MKTAGVGIDSWKLDVFKRHLDAAGFTYTEGPGITRDTLLLIVKCNWASELMPILEAANTECRKLRKSGPEDPS